jgi:hypothetical protein
MERTTWIAAAAFVAGAPVAQAAHPGLIFGQTHVNAVRVVASGDGGYDQISGASYPLPTQVSGYCPESAVETLAVVASGIPGSQAVDISDLRPGEKTVSLRPVLVPYSLTPIAWPAPWKQAVLAACNANLTTQMNAHHQTRAQVFAHDWPLGEVKVADVTAYLGCKSTGPVTQFDASGADYSQKIAGRVQVICGKRQFDDFAAPQRPKTPTNDLTYGVHVVQANLAILPKTGGNGPCGVTLSGVIETDAVDTTVTFFYRNNKGGTTPWRSVKTDHSKTAFFSDFIEFDKPGVAGGFVTAQPPGTPHAAGSAFAATPSGKDFNGTYQIVGKNIAFESNVGHFAFDCAAPPVAGFKAVAKPSGPTSAAPGNVGNVAPNAPSPTSTGTRTLPAKPVKPPKKLKSGPDTP